VSVPVTATLDARPSAPKGLLAQLASIVGGYHVLSDPDLTAGHEVDWTGRFTGPTPVVVRPRNPHEVAAVLRACAQYRVPVIPQGGNTGLVGGGVPRQGEAVLSTTRLTDLEPVDRLSGQVTVGAGATLAAVQRHVREAGYDIAVDLAARDSATIGGMVATNAGGLRVLRWGPMRSQVVGVEAVLADGRVMNRLSGLPKDCSGFVLSQLLVGSEGTLAVITRVRLRLIPLFTDRVTVLLALQDTATALRVLALVRGSVPSLDSAEITYADGVALVHKHLRLPSPFRTPTPYPVHLLLECAAQRDPADDLIEALERSPDLLDSAIATDEPSRRALWAHREGHTDAVNAAGVPLKLDVAVPLEELAAFEQEVRGLTVRHAPGARLVLFGHLAEGNYHVNILDAGDRDEELSEAVLRAVARRGGTISAEHGIGVAKARWLSLTRAAVDLDLAAVTKRAWDPEALLNPGVLFSADPA
jgi:FAD/FMN-containing dehydrogenase